MAVNVDCEVKDEIIWKNENDPSLKSLKLSFFGHTYCPLKHTFKDSFEIVLNKYLLETGDTYFKYFIPSACSDSEKYDDLWKTDDIDELPEIIVGAGFGDFFNQEFIDKFVKNAYFKAVPYTGIHKTFTSAGLIDPDGGYTIYSVFPLVMLIDKRKLGEMPVPKQWGDLLNPVYANNIIIGASHGDIHEDFLMYIYKEYGEQGLKMLAPNIKDGLHASQMAKLAGTNSSNGAAIYVIPWMFAKACPKTETTELIWPDDGALVTPMYMLVKKDVIESYQPFIDFLTGFDYGQKSANTYFPAANGEVDNKMPAGAEFKWLGWDYIKSQAIDELKECVMNIFKMNWQYRNEVEEIES